MASGYVALVIILVVLIAFGSVYACGYIKATRRLRAQGTPISHCEIFKKIFTCGGFILGVACCAAGAAAAEKASHDRDLEANNGDRVVEGRDGDGEGITVVQELRPVVLPAKNSRVHWVPVESVGTDPI